MSAVKVLKEYDCRQSKDILTRLVIHDPVSKVKNSAFRGAQALGISKNGRPIYLTKGKKGNLVKGINKKLEKVRNSLLEVHFFDDFKNKFKEIYPTAYDIYERNKNNFDGWLKNCESNLPHRK